MKTKLIKSALFTAMLTVGTLVSAQQNASVPEQTWTVNFKDTDIVEVVKFVQEITGKPIIVDPKVRGPIKVIANKPLNKKELYDLFLAVLDVNGFTAYESNGVVRVVANRDVRNLAIPNEERVNPKGANDGYVTQVIQLKNISAAKVLAALRPLVPQYGQLTAYEPSNALIIEDTRANIARINELIEQMDKAAILATDVVQLKYASANDVVNMINQLEKPDPNRGLATAPPIVVADKRINAVIISGDEMSRQRIKGVVESLDRPQTKNSNTRVVYLKYAKATDVAKVLSGMVQTQNQGAKPGEAAGSGGAANVQADEATNSVLISADVDTTQSLMAVIDSLDIRRAQVLVEAIIVEIQDNANKDLGVQWMYADSKNGFGSSTTGDGSLAAVGAGALQLKSDDTTVQDTGLKTLASALSASAGQSFGVARLGDRTSFLGLLKALKENSGTNILSTPNLLTTDNTKATIKVGQKVPFKTGSYTGTGTSGTTTGSTFSSPFSTYNREDVGITLEVTPHINEGDSVVLDIKQEVSSISNISSTDGIITNQRKIDTQILAADGQTVILGGLIKDDIQTSATRVPLLGSIPLLGQAFRTQSSKKVKTNLLVFIRTTVMRDDKMLVGATAEKYKAIRETQLHSRKTEKEIIDSKSIPVLPEWKEPAAPVEAVSPAGNTAPAPVQGE